MKDLKEGGFVIIDNTPCRIEKISISTVGKHGAAKCRVEAIGVFDRKRRSIVKPADDQIEVPIIEKKLAQVLAFLGEDKVQLMDLQDYSVFEVEIPEELKGKLEQGKEVNYFEIMGIKTLKQIK